MIAFGPVPSRRLGRSLGINNIPPKTCSYTCVYCQLGQTTNMQISREPFYHPEDILEAVRIKVDETRMRDETIDYLTIVPDGEPTLDINLGETLAALRELGIPIAVISNASLIDHKEVRQALQRADWVSLKVDSVRPESWWRIDRPHGHLDLARILRGIRAFASEFEGLLATESMLVHGVNDRDEDIQEIASFLEDVGPNVAYLAVPTRPPAERWVEASEETQVNYAYHVFSAVLDRVEYLLGYEGNAFASSGDAEADLLSIAAVHPMREDAVQRLLASAGSDWGLVERLIQQQKLVALHHKGNCFYLRRISRA